jgi:putative oxidoreductase
MPAFVAYGVYIGEVIAPVLVILGWYSRIGSLLIAINMVFALSLAHRADLFNVATTGGYALELQAMYLLTAIAIALMGPGRYSMNER